MLKNLRKKAQGMVEYAILLAGVSLVSIAAVSVLGEKTAGLIATTAVVLPGAQDVNNGPIFVGQLVESLDQNPLGIAVDLDTILANSGTNRVNLNFFNDQIAMFPDIIVHN